MAWSSKNITAAQHNELVRHWVEDVALSTAPMTDDDYAAVDAALSRIFLGRRKRIIRFAGLWPSTPADRADAAARAADAAAARAAAADAAADARAADRAAADRAAADRAADAAARAADAAARAADAAAARADAADDPPIYTRTSMWLWDRVYCAYAEMCGWTGDWTDAKTIATRCGSLIFGARNIWICDRPRVLKTTGAPHYLPHCDDGPWLRYADGQEDYAIGGLRLPKQVVMAPETQTIAEIDAERNNDIRSIRLARFGIARYLQETGATVLDEAPNEIEGTHEALLRTTRGDTYFWPTDPSGKTCPPLLVPGDLITCESARRWLASDLDPSLCFGRT